MHANKNRPHLNSIFKLDVKKTRRIKEKKICICMFFRCSTSFFDIMQILVHSQCIEFGTFLLHTLIPSFKLHKI